MLIFLVSSFPSTTTLRFHYSKSINTVLGRSFTLKIKKQKVKKINIGESATSYFVYVYLVQNFSLNWQFWVFGSNLPKKSTSGLKQKKWTPPLNSACSVYFKWTVLNHMSFLLNSCFYLVLKSTQLSIFFFHNCTFTILFDHFLISILVDLITRNSSLSSHSVTITNAVFKSKRHFSDNSDFYDRFKKIRSTSFLNLVIQFFFSLRF